MYMQPSYVVPTDALSVEPPYVEMTDKLAVTVTTNLFLVHNSLLSFNIEENGFMKIIQAS